MTNKKTQNSNVINPKDKKQQEEFQQRIDFANVEIQRVLEKYTLAILPYIENQIVNGLIVGTRPRVTFIQEPKKDDKKAK